MVAEAWPAEALASDFTTDQLEAMVLRGIVAFPARRKAVFDTLQPTDFHHGHNSSVFQALADMHHDRSPLTFSAITDELDRRDWLRHVGGLGVLNTVRYIGYEGDPLLLAHFLLDHVRRKNLQATVTEIAGQASDPDFDTEQAAEKLLVHTRSPREYGIDKPAELRDEVVEQITHGADRGMETGFGKLDPFYRVAPGLVTIVTGIPGSGKSTFLDGMTVNLAAKNGWQFAVFSPESAPTIRHMRRLGAMFCGEKLTGSTDPTKRDRALDFVDAHYTWINSTDGVSVEEILRRAEVIHRTKSLNGLVLDPWNEIDHVRDRNQREDEYISHALTLIRRFARRYQLHVWVVAHPTKMQKRADGTYDTPTLYDISGGAQWRNKADMGLVVHRQAGLDFTEVHVAKVRFADHGEMYRSAKVYFHPSFEGFRDDPPQGWQEGPL